MQRFESRRLISNASNMKVTQKPRCTARFRRYELVVGTEHEIDGFPCRATNAGFLSSLGLVLTEAHPQALGDSDNDMSCHAREYGTGRRDSTGLRGSI